MTDFVTATATEAQPKWNYSNRISRRDANRAIYFDLEGRMDQEPVLMGVYSRGWFRQYVFDRTFAPLVRSSRAAGERVFRRRFSDALEEALLGPAERDELRLVALSEHELTVVHSFVGAEAAERVSRSFLNARKFAAAWVSRDRPEVRSENDPRTLGDFAQLCGFEWPDEYDLQPADAIKRLHSRLDRLPPNEPPGAASIELWARLLGYNRFDCYAMKHVVAGEGSPTALPLLLS